MAGISGTFPKELLEDLIDRKIDQQELNDPYVVVVNRQIDSLRWVSVHELIFRDDSQWGACWRTTYELGLTEEQDYEPFEYEPDLIECHPVRPVPTTVIEYVVVD